MKMQKTITTITTNNTDTELDPNFILQAKIGMCSTLTNTANESTQLKPLMGIEETYAELPQIPEENQLKKQDDENPATQPDTQDNAQPDAQDDVQEAPQNNSQTTQAKNLFSTIYSLMNPLNWLPRKNTTTQPKIIIEEKDLNKEGSSANLNEEESSNDKIGDPFSNIETLAPDDSEFKDPTSTDSSLTGDDSNLQDN